MKIKEILEKDTLSHQDICDLLRIDNKPDFELLRNRAYEIMKEHCGEKVFLRGLVEFSNICRCDCNYCGIRKSNKNVDRYLLDKEEILAAARKSVENGYASFVMQSGDRDDPQFIDFVIDVVKAVKKATVSDKLPKGLGITLCIGEQTYENYKRLFDAGIHRYLLRIETSNEKLFQKLHSVEQSYQNRVRCLKSLKDIGYQVGTGVMIGFPEQTIEDLAKDVLFFKDMDIDMIGMGPYIVHKDTPMGKYFDEYQAKKQETFELGIKMIAVCRIVLKDVNIASTTALQAMYDDGREQGLLCGANVLMPQHSPFSVRKQYQLYEGKPFLDEADKSSIEDLEKRVHSIGRTLGYHEWGDSKHFQKRNK